jgi:hypothetical protein
VHYPRSSRFPFISGGYLAVLQRLVGLESNSALTVTRAGALVALSSDLPTQSAKVKHQHAMHA